MGRFLLFFLNNCHPKKTHCGRISFAISSFFFLLVSGLLFTNTARAQIIVETFENNTWSTGVVLTNKVLTNTTALPSTVVAAGSSWGSIAVTVPVSSVSTAITTSIRVVGAASTSCTISTDAPTTTGNYTWAFSEATMCTASSSHSAHSFSHMLSIANDNSYLITPTIPGGIATVSFWAYSTKKTSLYMGLRTNTGVVPLYPTTVATGTSSTTNTGGAVSLFHLASSSSSFSTNAVSFSHFIFSVPSTATSIYTNPAQFAIVDNGSTAFTYIDDIEITGPPTITLGTISAKCYSTSSQIASLPYTATSESPTKYSISGWAGGGSFATVTGAALPASPISITVPASTPAGTYTANLTVNDGTYTSVTYPISITVNAQPTTATIPSGATSFYKLNGNGTDTTNAYPGTVEGSPTPITDQYGNANSAYNFNGSTDYIATEAASTIAISGPTTFSVAVWFNTTNGNAGEILGFGNAFTGGDGNYDRMLYINGGKLVFGVYNNGMDTINSTALYNDGNWHMAVGTESPTNGLNLYVDGALVASNVGYNSPQVYSGYWRIGNENAWSGNSFFTGSLNNVVIYNTTELTAAQISGLYSGTSAGSANNICFGSTLSLTTTTVPGATYSWSGVGTFSPGTTTQNPTVTSPAAGTYTVVTTSNGCSTTGKVVVTITPSTISSTPSGVTNYYKLNTNALDTTGLNNGKIQGSPTAVADHLGNANSAYSFNSATGDYIATGNPASDPLTFSVSTWFKTTGLTAGVLVGFGNDSIGGNTSYDRELFINAGKVVCGVYNGGIDTINSPLQYNDGNWHFAAFTESPTNGLKLYVDGVNVASNAAYNVAQSYSGFWRIGNDNAWVGNNNFTGSLDNVLIFGGTELTANDVYNLYTRVPGTTATQTICAGSSLIIDETSVTGATYAWTGPNSFSSTQQNNTITAATTAAAGTYRVTMTTNGCNLKDSIIATVNKAILTLSSAVHTDSQTVCTLGNAITNITYTVGGVATSAGIVWSSTPTGLTYGYSGGVYTISGAPTVAGVYTYTITTTGGACSAGVATGSVAAYDGNTWTGTTSTDWNTSTNWTCGVPVSTDNVVIQNVTNKPVLSGNVTIKNLTLNTTATLSIGSNTLTINGAISGGGKLNGSITSNMEFGTTASGTMNFTTGLAFLKNLTIDAGATITLGSSLGIASTGILTIGTGSTFATGSHLILESDNSGSARVAAIPVNGAGIAQGSITGTVSVLCYIHSTLNAQGITVARRAWRLLTAPVSNFGLGTPTTIYTSWQTNGISLPLQGLFVTGPPSAVTAADGLDAGVNGNYSMYTWNAATQKLVAVGSPKTTNISNATGIADNIAYFTFVRGDRTPSLVAFPNGTNQTNTTITSAGTLMEGDQSFSSTTGIISATGGGLSMIGNPFASSIDFSYIAGDNGSGTAQSYSGLSNVLNRFYIWNSNLSGSQNVGGYVCIDDQDYDGNYTETLGATGTAATADKNIQSGQAFFVMTGTTAPASIKIKEASKSTVNNYIYRPATNDGSIQNEFSANLSLLNADSTASLADGAVAEFRSSFCDCVDQLDAPKFTGFDEMISLARNNQLLCIERRPEIADKDTLFLDLKQMQQRAYQFKFTTAMANHPGLGIHLEDAYTGIHTPLNINGSNNVDFSIDGNTASQAERRFMIVFGGVNIVPAYTNIQAVKKGNTVVVQWSLSNDASMTSYALQRSTDGGVTYTTVYTTVAQHTGIYSWIDNDPQLTNNYYRVISTDVLSEQAYSPVVDAAIAQITVSGITVFPNPIQNGQIGVAMNNMQQGIYLYELDNKIGQVIQTGTIDHPGGNATTVITLNKQIAKGSYTLKIVAPDNTTTAINVLY